MEIFLSIFSLSFLTDADCSAPAWPRSGMLNKSDEMIIPCKRDAEPDIEHDEKAEGNGKKIHEPQVLRDLVFLLNSSSSVPVHLISFSFKNHLF